MEYRATLNVIVRRFFVVRHLLPTKDKPLLRRRNTLLLLNALLDPRDRLVTLNINLNLLAGERLDLDLRITSGASRGRAAQSASRSGAWRR